MLNLACVLCCSSVVVDDYQESSRLICPAVTDEADLCSEGTAADETYAPPEPGLGS